MLALLLSPIYIAVNTYVVLWMLKWMGSCSYLFRTAFFRGAYVLLYIFLATSLLSGFLVKRPRKLRRFLKHTGNYFLGTFLYIVITILIGDFIRILLLYTIHPAWMGSRISFVLSGTLCTMIILLLSFLGIQNARRITVTPYEIHIHKQTKNLEKLKIVLLADTHFGHNTTQKRISSLMTAIEKEKPDLICIAGDFFDNEFDALYSPEQLKNSFKALQVPYGIYACWGNHDYEEPILAGFTFPNAYKGNDQMRRFLEDCNIQILEDQAVSIDDNFYLIGRKDDSTLKKQGYKRMAPETLTQGLDHRKPMIFLDHQPKELQEIANAGGDLDLCGHTHGGQLFPSTLTIRAIWENPCGYSRKDRLHVIVTSGAGTWGPNMRLGSKNEICSITVHFP